LRTDRRERAGRVAARLAVWQPGHPPGRVAARLAAWPPAWPCGRLAAGRGHGRGRSPL